MNTIKHRITSVSHVISPLQFVSDSDNNVVVLVLYRIGWLFSVRLGELVRSTFLRRLEVIIRS